jgi:hypothetical protein
MEKAGANLNGHATGKGGYSQADTYGNLRLLDPTIALDSQKNVINLYCCEILFVLETIKYQTVI